MQLEGSSGCFESPLVVSVHFRAFVDRGIAVVFANFTFQNGAFFRLAKWLASSKMNGELSLVNILAQF